MNNRGFTLIEFLLVIAILVILISSASSLLFNNVWQEDLEAKAAEVADLITRAHDYSVTGYESDDWSIKVLDNTTDCDKEAGTTAGDCLILYKGTSYVGRSVGYDKIVNLNTGVYLDPTETNDFYFAYGSGWLSTSSGALAEQRIILKSNIGEQKIVTTTPTGLTYYGD